MSRTHWIVGGAVAAAAVGGYLVLSPLLRDSAPSKTATTGGAIDAGRPRSNQPLPGAAPGAVPPFRQDPAAVDRVQPYRPAKFLVWSEGVPSTNPADDDRASAIERLLEVTRADASQQHTLRAAWKLHEDGRRELLAKAHPPSIGLPVLDPAGLRELDRAFDEVVRSTLTDQQRERLALEQPPPAPEEPPPEP
jgi:hypothetical protein